MKSSSSSAPPLPTHPASLCADGLSLSFLAKTQHFLLPTLCHVPSPFPLPPSLAHAFWAPIFLCSRERRRRRKPPPSPPRTYSLPPPLPFFSSLSSDDHEAAPARRTPSPRPRSPRRRSQTGLLLLREGQKEVEEKRGEERRGKRGRKKRARSPGFIVLPHAVILSLSWLLHPAGLPRSLSGTFVLPPRDFAISATVLLASGVRGSEGD